MKTVKYKDVEPLEQVFFTEVFKSKRAGNKKVVVTFNSKEIEGIRASSKYTVHE